MNLTPGLHPFAEVARNLGSNRDVDRIVLAHTHQPLAGLELGRTGLWNTGSWIYEPPAGSRGSYVTTARAPGPQPPC